MNNSDKLELVLFYFCFFLLARLDSLILKGVRFSFLVVLCAL